MVTNGLSFSERVMTELEQSSDEGHNVNQFEDEARLINDTLAMGQPRELEAKDLMDQIRRAPMKNDYPYYEPSNLKKIKTY
jgi:hypothetical protein